MISLERIHESKMIFTVKTNQELIVSVLRGAHIQNKRLVITNLQAFKGCLPTLAANVADFGDKSAPEPVKAMSAWIINQAAQQLGVKLNSPNALYTAVAEGKIAQQFAVPAVNIRGNSLDTARALFNAANHLNVGALIVEIARSEIGYTNQTPREFAAVVQAAAILEGWRGPLFLQGDHIQLDAKKMKKGGEEADKEQAAHSALIRSCLVNGFGSIDLDMSPAEDRRKDESELTWDAQQRGNYVATAQKVLEVRRLQAELGLPYTVMLGGETGEVGKMNTRNVDIEAYAQGLIRELKRIKDETGLDLEGIRKIAVQTGTSHGGVTLPDGKVAKVKIDFNVLAMAQEVASQFGWAGPVQHGASTLPDEAFNKFVESGAAEVHLATGLQDILVDQGIAKLPDMHARFERYIAVNFGKEWKEETEPGKTTKTWPQFYRDTRKKANGPFKYEIWTMPEDVRAAVSDSLANKFAFLFGELGVIDTKTLVSQHVSDVEFQLPYPEEAGTVMVEVAPKGDGSGLAD